MSRCIEILLPYYGDPDLMRAAVESVLRQDSPDWRLTVIDDCYPDPWAGSWIQELQHPSVQYLRNDRNLGANATYRKAVDMATAEHLVVLGADDLLLPHYVSRMVEVLGRFPDAAVVQPGVEVVDGAGVPVRPVRDRVKAVVGPKATAPTLLHGEPLVTSLLRGNWTYFPSLCWRRDLAARVGFRPGLDVVQDLALLVDVVMAGGSLLLDPEVSFCYRRHARSDSSVRALRGDRFAEEKGYFVGIAASCRQRGWSRAETAARRHLASRLHAAFLVPTAVRHRDTGALRTLARHAVS